MILASKAFFLFLLIVVVGYHLLRGRTAKYAFLLVASYIFYALCSPWYLWVLLLLTITDYLAAKRIEDASNERSRRRWLILSIVSNLGLLAAFKYTGFAYDTGLSLGHWFGYETAPRAWEILLPLGISFHTFQGISYTVDVYRKQIMPSAACSIIRCSLHFSRRWLPGRSCVQSSFCRNWCNRHGYLPRRSAMACTSSRADCSRSSSSRIRSIRCSFRSFSPTRRVTHPARFAGR